MPGSLGRHLCPGRQSGGGSVRSWTDRLASRSIDWPTRSFAPSLLQPSGVLEGRARGERLHAQLWGCLEPASAWPRFPLEVELRRRPTEGRFGEQMGFCCKAGAWPLDRAQHVLDAVPAEHSASRPWAPSASAEGLRGRGFPAGLGSWAFLWWTVGAIKGLGAKGQTGLRLSEM